MAAWFEEIELDAEDLEIADDVTFSPNLRIHVEPVVGELYTVTGGDYAGTASGATA